MVLLLQSRRRNRTKLFVGLAVVAGLLILGVVLLTRGLPRYKRWKQERALTQAKAYLEQRDPQNARLALDVAFDAVPGNPAAWRTAAEMLEQVHEPAAVRLRRQVVQMVPDSAEDRSAWVRSALTFGDINVARDAMSGMTPEQASTDAGLQASLAFALATGNAPMADMLFDQLRSKEGDGDSLRVSQALLHLQHPDAKRVEAARAALIDFARLPAYHLRVARELTGYALRVRDYDLARRWSDEAVSDADSTFEDRLTRANIALLVDKRPLEEIRAELEPTARSDAENARQYLRWLLVQGRTDAADTWRENLPVELIGAAEVKEIEAEIAAVLKQWDRLATLLNAGAWGTIDPVTVELAMTTRVLAQRDNPGLRADLWDEAIDSAGGNLSGLRVLLRLAATWSYEPGSEHTLWRIAHLAPDQTWAHQRLFTVYRSQGKPARMRDVMLELRTQHPGVARYDHDWALLTLLLEPVRTWGDAKDIMRRLHEAEPENPNYATGYAFALAQADRGEEAVAVAEAIPAAFKAQAARAPYLAYVYAVAGDRERMEHFRRAAQGADMLDEERQLLANAPDVLDRSIRAGELKARQDERAGAAEGEAIEAVPAAP